MASIYRLTAKQIDARKERGRLADGGGLYLQVTKWGETVSKSWEFRYTQHGKTRSMGLGPYGEGFLKLGEARDEAETLRRMVREGKDPIEERKAAKLTAKTEQARRITFKDAVDTYMKSGRIKNLGNDKHRKQWRSTLDNYAVPTIGEMDVAHISKAGIIRILEPIWATKHETASRLRGRIESVLNSESVIELRSGANPASAKVLRGWIDEQGKIEKGANHAALPLSDLSAWFASLKKRDGIAARALEFLTLCASHSGEVRGAVWSEFDLDTGLWVIPKERMKAKNEHRVPLSEAAIAVLQAMPRIVGNDFVFPAARGGALSDMSLSAVMRRMHASEVKAGRSGWLDQRSGRPAVPHGLRSTFRDWAAETGIARDMAEIALAHTVGNEVERAYRRSDMVERRRAMMDAWSARCRGEEIENVVQLRGTV